MKSPVRFLQAMLKPILLLTLALSAPTVPAADNGQTFATPEAAVSALATATGSQDSEAISLIFGPASTHLKNPDRVQAANELEAFASALSQTHRIVRESDSLCILEVGDDFWPFPVPLVKEDGRWFFDTEAGEDELLNRRIGRNELATLQSVRAYVEAQRDYASRDRDGDEVLEFAQRIVSTPGLKDGLYWPPELDGEISPLGPLVAQAQAVGYGATAREEGASPEPFNGYLFRILTRQTAAAPGGEYDYGINGNMIGGFALVAWPADYDQSGIMTFIVNQQGRVYQQDLGPETEQIVGKIQAYNPDNSWTVSPD